MVSYKIYCEGIKKFGGKITMTEDEYNVNYGITKYTEPLFIGRKYSSPKDLKPTLENHIKEVTQKKKIKVVQSPALPKTPRKVMSQEERREKKLSQDRAWRAKQKAQGIKTLIDPQKAQKLREEALERYHKNKPVRTRVLYKDLTAEEIAQRKKEAKQRYNEKAKAEGRIYNRKKPQTQEEIIQARELKRLYAHRPDQVIRRKAYREANKMKLLEQNKEWVLSNPQKRKVYQDKADAKRRGSHKDTTQLTQTKPSVCCAEALEYEAEG